MKLIILPLFGKKGADFPHVLTKARGISKCHPKLKQKHNWSVAFIALSWNHMILIS
jgi:hypothetical protein